MSKKKNVVSLNLTKNKSWNSSWYIHKEEYNFLFQQDLLLYSYIRSQLSIFQINNIRLYRTNNLMIIDLMLINSKLLNTNLLSDILNKLNIFFNKNVFISINTISYMEVLKNGFNLALKIAKYIEKRVKFRSKIVKSLLIKVKENVKGVYVQCTGRINNVDMARTDKLYLGSLPLQSIKHSISYGFVVANTVKGLQSIKVWICK
jgi:small subunit ribosomal protein S3